MARTKRELAVLENAIDSLTDSVRWRRGGDRRGGWWVLAVGRRLDEDDFDAREAAREDLARLLAQKGVRPAQRVWVWDETDRVQLVLARAADEARARELALAFNGLGLHIRVRRELGEPDFEQDPNPVSGSEDG